MHYKTDTLAGWGNYPLANCHLYRPEQLAHLQSCLQETLIARGLGRSYGDAATNSERGVVLMERLNRFIAFDSSNGILRAEAGCSLKEIIDTFMPRGWFLPVTPGTKFTTLGGCIAADVHGKNHHQSGSFGMHVKQFELMLADGSIKQCSESHEKELFWATVGGMGLTGLITEISLQLTPIKTRFIKSIHYAAGNLEAAIERLEDPALDDHYSVAWIDCLASGSKLGRSIVMTGHHASCEEIKANKRDPLSLQKKLRLTVPCFFPNFFLNSWTVKVFNSVYYHLQKARPVHQICDFDSFFYPLDFLRKWNRLYGRNGFLQYQCVVPSLSAPRALERILTVLAKNESASFLAVLKRFGPKNPGYLSFPIEGYTLALDTPLYDPKIFTILDALDAIVMEHGGRVYLAKDARLSAENFHKMYPRYMDWLAIKKSIDPNGHFQSDLSRRLKIGESLS